MPTETFNEKLIKRLKTDSRFVDNAGELITAAVKDSAWKLDTALVKSLLGEPELKAKFSPTSMDTGYSTTTPSLPISPTKTSSPTLTPDFGIKSD